MRISEAILATLAYHDTFDYPLTLEEVHKYLIDKKISLSQIQKELAKIKSAQKIGERQGYYYLKGRQKIVTARIQRAKHSKIKLKRAKLFSYLLSLIPTVQMIAVSGALAMGNSHKNDDIDFVIITAKNTLWSTRFLANMLLWPFKRKPSHKRLITNNKACLNLFLDESDLKIKDKNLYTAHEIAQMKVTWDRDKTYSRFIKANSWLKNYLPNWRSSFYVIPARFAKAQARRAKAGIHFPLSIFENLLKKFQLWYMRKRITTERIGETQIFFHPQNAQDRVLTEYQKRLKKLKAK